MVYTYDEMYTSEKLSVKYVGVVYFFFFLQNSLIKVLNQLVEIVSGWQTARECRTSSGSDEYVFSLDQKKKYSGEG